MTVRQAIDAVSKEWVNLGTLFLNVRVKAKRTGEDGARHSEAQR
jgi:hypothetical protein